MEGDMFKDWQDIAPAGSGVMYAANKTTTQAA
jgi:hypothetical protein